MRFFLYYYFGGLWWFPRSCTVWKVKVIYTDTGRLGLSEMRVITVVCSCLTCLFWSLNNSPVFSITCSSVNWAYGCSLHKVRISHRVTPNAHTSLAMVNLPCRNTDGQTHRAVCEFVAPQIGLQKDIPEGCFPKTSSGWGALLVPLCGSNLHGKGSGSCRSRRSWWCYLCPLNSCV